MTIFKTISGEYMFKVMVSSSMLGQGKKKKDKEFLAGAKNL